MKCEIMGIKILILLLIFVVIGFLLRCSYMRDEYAEKVAEKVAENENLKKILAKQLKKRDEVIFQKGQQLMFKIPFDNCSHECKLSYEEFVDLLSIKNKFDAYKKEFEEYKKKENERIAKLNGPTFVYLMFDRAKKYYKIGITHDVPKREKTLLSETPNIDVITKKLFPTNIAARKTEKMLHNIFKEKNVRGEWFNLNNDDLDVVKTLLN